MGNDCRGVRSRRLATCFWLMMRMPSRRRTGLSPSLDVAEGGMVGFGPLLAARFRIDAGGDQRRDQLTAFRIDG